MSKILLKINKEEELTYPADGYILGIDKFSYLFNKTFSIEDIKKIRDNVLYKEIYVSFNKIIFNDEIEEYKKYLKLIDDIGLDGIIVGDIAALTYNLKTNIILDQMHLNNSYYTINHYANNGVNGVILTNDITKKEIEEITKNTDILTFKQVFGYPHLSTSNRYFVSNYLKHFKIKDKSSFYKISEKNSSSYYQVIEDDFGTHILGDKVLNLLGNNLNVDYEIVDGFMIDNIKDVLKAFYEHDYDKKEYFNKIYDASTGFINKETIYRVKKDER